MKNLIVLGLMILLLVDFACLESVPREVRHQNLFMAVIPLGGIVLAVEYYFGCRALNQTEGSPSNG